MFASGFGSNLKHIHREIIEGRLSGAELALVLSNNSASGALEYARKHSIPSKHLSLASACGDVERFEKDLMDEMDERKIQIVALAGYLKKLPDSFVDRFEYKIVNVHPALLPSFGGSAMYGIRVHEAVLARGCKVSGASVHFVTREYDSGPIVLQQCCPVMEEDTPESLQRRVRDIEFELFPKAIGLLAQDKLIVENNRVHILP
ncbi:MAG: phosphoribosylglycinamide formyltransferase [Candidatus Kapaibacterium sp.]